MVCDTEYPSFLLASCCKVEVVKGAAGLRVPGFTSTELTIKSDPIQLSKNFKAWSLVSKRFGSSALNFLLLNSNSATILKADLT